MDYTTIAIILSNVGSFIAGSGGKWLLDFWQAKRKSKLDETAQVFKMQEDIIAGLRLDIANNNAKIDKLTDLHEEARKAHSDCEKLHAVSEEKIANQKERLEKQSTKLEEQAKQLTEQDMRIREMETKYNLLVDKIQNGNAGTAKK